MKTVRIASLAVTASLIAVLAGCGAATPGVGLTVRAAVTKASTAKAAPVKTSVKSSVKAPAGTSAAVVSRLAEVAAQGAGSVSVKLSGLGATGYRLMAVSDVTSVTATLTSSAGAVQTRSVGVSAGSLTFEGVSAGTATLSVKAFDASGLELGAGSTTATVIAGQTVQAALSITIAAAPTATATATPAPTTGVVAATITFVDAAATPSPTPSPVASTLPGFLAASPTPTPAASGLPSFLTPSATPSTVASTGSRDVWGRIYNATGVQQTAGTVRFKATNGTSGFDTTATLRADGYYFVAAVPVGPTIEVTATSGALTSSAGYLFADDSATAYDWLDLFVGAGATPTPAPSTGTTWSNWFSW